MNICPGCGNEVTVVQTVWWPGLDDDGNFPTVWWHFGCHQRAEFIEKQPSRLFQVEGIGL